MGVCFERIRIEPGARAQEEKYNELLSSTTKRIASVLKGETDPGPPIRNDPERKRTFKTKEEVCSASHSSIFLFPTPSQKLQACSADAAVYLFLCRESSL